MSSTGAYVPFTIRDDTTPTPTIAVLGSIFTGPGDEVQVFFGIKTLLAPGVQWDPRCIDQIVTHIR
jgi:hypothetical protein